jgi:hypothetical protein
MISRAVITALATFLPHGSLARARASTFGSWACGHDSAALLALTSLFRLDLADELVVRQRRWRERYMRLRFGRRRSGWQPRQRI